VVEPERRSKIITHRWPAGHSERIQALQETAGSLPLYKRYVAGEFRDVWTELAALGDAIWLDPVAADALAVCFETMHRAKTNIETLVGNGLPQVKKSVNTSRPQRTDFNQGYFAITSV
jgi:hypothetical protein